MAAESVTPQNWGIAMTFYGLSAVMRRFVWTCCTTLIFCVQIHSAAAQTPGIKENSFRQDGVRRSYLTYTPKGAAEQSGNRPLVVVLHGGGGTHRGMMRITKRRWNHLADLHGFYVVYPNARAKEWDFGEGPTSANRKHRVDDLAYFERVIDDVSARHPIDADLVFATGLSRGAAASYFLACKLSDRIRAIAPVAMPLPAYLEDDCPVGPPVGIAIINGTEDPQVPYDGGWISVFGVKRDPILSTDGTIDLWRERNGCVNAASASTTIDQPGDKTSVTKTEWSDCSGAPVRLYKIENGGHTWPSGTQYLPARLVGEVSADIDGADEAWQFFSQVASIDTDKDEVADSRSEDYFGNELPLPGFPNRPYDIFVPANLKTPAPVVLALHGGGADAPNAVKTTCPDGNLSHADCITNHAAQNGYIAVFPRGTARKIMRSMRSWNAGGGDSDKQWTCVSGPACEGNVNDIAYFEALLNELENTAEIDRRRLYAIGISNGAAMSHRLACEMSDRFAAITAVEGANQFSTTQTCAPSRPVPVLQIHGTADCAWPYEGGKPTCKGAPQLDGRVISIQRSNEVWARINGCAEEPKRESLRSRNRDNTSVEKFTWQQCNAPLMHYRIEGGGHTWPNGYQYLPRRTIGAVTRKISNDDIWNFLSAHELP